MLTIKYMRNHRPQSIRLPIAKCITLLSAALLGCIHALSAQDIESSITDNPFVTEGYAQLQEGNTDVALEAFSKALESNANELSALLGQAMIYAGLLDHQKAFHSYDSIIQKYPRHIDAWGGRGLAAFNLGDFDSALSSFMKATADQPINGFYYESLAWTFMCRGEFEEAAKTAKTATLMYGRKGETSIYPLLIAYFAYIETGDSEAAKRTLTYAEKNRPLNQWPSPVIDYLAGKIDENALISFVMDTAQETEAHTYIGLKLKQSDQFEVAEKHLAWVSEHGDPRVFEQTLARTFQLRNSVAILVP
ncbi:MAG: tetratricopeptide repeat protein [Opitutaceae bacterium]